MTKFFKGLSNQKIKRFLFFLGIASLFWILTKFGREFTAPLTAEVNYLNLPETAVLDKNNAEEIHFDLTANGFEILYYKLRQPVVDIYVNEFYVQEKDSFLLNQNELKQQIENQFNKYLDIRNIFPNPFIVKLKPIIEKKVPVIATTEISFKEGFNGIEAYRVIPDSVVLTGAKEIIGQIDTVYTETLALKGVDTHISEKVVVEKPFEEIVSISPPEVEIQWAVSEFAQEQYTLPVTIINLPPDLELKMVPSHVTVSFDISISEFSQVLKENFKIVCDYSKRKENQNFLLPEIIKQPEGAVNISINPKKIDFFILKN